MKCELKKKILFLVIIILIIAISLLGVNIIKNYKPKTNIKEKVKIILNDYVITEKEVDIYKLSNDKYEKIGLISQDVVLHLEKYNDKYYKLLDFDNEYYIRPDSLTNYNEEIIIQDRHKKYIPFNLNIKTNDKINLYDENDKLIYSINGNYSLPIIIKEEKRFGIEFANKLLYVKSDEVEIIENENTELVNTKGIPTLNYHFFYDENDTSCNQEICASKAQFKDHLDYIKENNILTLKMKEVEMYIDKKIQLPQSVLITIDDGYKTEMAIQMLTEYKMYATIFLVTSWHDPKTYNKTDYIELHSHSHDLHKTGDCPTGQGGGIQCLEETRIQEDLKVSREKLNNTTYFCYPFYEYNNYSIEMLKKAGFTMAFVGESFKSDNLTKPGSNKFKLPRFVVVNYTTMNDFSKYLSSSK